ncbi:hypothetical protein Kisp02_14860 [Kineosporia sp. NBRC 101731]|nr:hypothetical protein Kisp02_14860 [Kineosporia sp. NBRC 101731]
MALFVAAAVVVAAVVTEDEVLADDVLEDDSVVAGEAVATDLPRKRPEATSRAIGTANRVTRRGVIRDRR